MNRDTVSLNINEEELKDYFSRLSNKIYKVLPIFEGRDSLTKEVTIDDNIAYKSYLLYIKSLINTMTGFHNTTKHCSEYYNTSTLQEIIYRIEGLLQTKEHKIVKKKVMSSIKLLENIMEV